MVNIDIVSGFLGAGKTTFIQTMLKHYMDKGQRTVYVVNEFGQQGIDGLLMENEQCAVYELTNGCICCSLRTEFVEVLKDIIEKVKPDRIVFEPSGVFVFSDFFAFLKGDAFKDRCKVDHCICIVDAVTFPKLYRGASYFMENQIRNAGLVILSKVQMPGAAVEETLCDIKNINPQIGIVNMPWDAFSTQVLDDILDVTPYQPAELTLSGRRRLGSCVGKAYTAKKNIHTAYETLSMEVAPFEDMDVLQAFVGEIVGGSYGDVIRGKGFANLPEGTFLVNIVANTVDITPYAYTMDGVFTLIGTGLNPRNTT